MSTNWEMNRKNVYIYTMESYSETQEQTTNTFGNLNETQTILLSETCTSHTKKSETRDYML